MDLLIRQRKNIFIPDKLIKLIIRMIKLVRIKNLFRFPHEIQNQMCFHG